MRLLLAYLQPPIEFIGVQDIHELGVAILAEPAHEVPRLTLQVIQVQDSMVVGMG